MKPTLELTREQARRIAVRAQLLDAPRPTDALEVVRRLTVLQADHTAAVAHNAHLVLWSRLGTSYSPAVLDDALEDRTLVELQGMIRPAEDIALFRAEFEAWPGAGELKPWQQEVLEWVEDNEECRAEILDRLEEGGPLPARDLPDRCAVPWKSSGWTNNKSVLKLITFMEARGEVAVGARSTRERLWDLAERVYPPVADVPPLADAIAERNLRRLQALGIARAKSVEVPGERNDVGSAGVTAVVEGVKGQWQVDPARLDGDFTGRAALLSPLDRLVFDRKRIEEIFEFDYQLEMYKPAASRRWGYWALPVLYGDRLVGKLDATADRDAGLLRVDALHEDAPFSSTVRDAVEEQVEELARWLGLEVG